MTYLILLITVAVTGDHFQQSCIQISAIFITTGMNIQAPAEEVATLENT